MPHPTAHPARLLLRPTPAEPSPSPADVPRLLYAVEHGTIWLSADPRTAPDAPGTPVARSGIFR